jgi:hypothetical protein
MISAMPNTPMASGHEADAVRQLRDAEGEALLAGLHVRADQAERHAEHHHATDFNTEPCASTAEMIRPSSISEK